MSYLDIILLLPLVYGLIRGLMRGIVKEIFAIVGIILGIVVARMFAGDAAVWLQQLSSWDVNLLKPIAAFVIFMAVALLCNLLAGLLTRLIKMISLSWVNRLVGGLFGVAKWALIVVVIVACIDMLDGLLHFIRPELKQSAVCYTYALQAADYIKSFIIK